MKTDILSKYFALRFVSKKEAGFNSVYPDQPIAGLEI